MKPRKIHRNRRRFHRRRSQFPWRILLSVIVLLALVAGGIFAAKGITAWKHNKKNTSTATKKTQAVVTNASVTTATTTAVPVKPIFDVTKIKAFVMKTENFQDQAKREYEIKMAAKTGMNAVLVDIKDETGVLYYASSSKDAKANNAIDSKALSKEDLKNFVDFCEKQNVAFIPRLHCFKDRTAPSHMTEARIQLQGEPKYLWLDNTAARGGKPWLNPYSPEAHAYLQSFVKELSDLGCKAICLDSVQFPEVTVLASYGNTKYSQLSQLDVLKQFVKDTQKIAGNTKCILATNTMSTLTDSTPIYGGNPLQMGATVVAPALYPSYFGSSLSTGTEVLQDPASHPAKALQMAFAQINLRVKLMKKGEQPSIVPFVQVFDYEDKDVASEIKAIRAANGKDAGFILYSYDGSYHFDQYGLK